MTKKQRALLAFIDAYTKAHGLAPTFAEMRVAIDTTTNSMVHKRLQELEQLGAIRRTFRRRREIIVVTPPDFGDAEARLALAGPALLRACQLQRDLIERMRREKHFPVFRSDAELLDAATQAATHALALAAEIPPDAPTPTGNTGEHAHA